MSAGAELTWAERVLDAVGEEARFRSAQPAGARALELQEEFHGPVSYAGHWVWLALLALCLVALYYAAVLWLTRDRSDPAGPWTGGDSPSVREQHLDRIARIETAVHAGRVPAREGHQQLSEAVRSYVGAVSTIPAPTMTLADLRRQAPRPLTEAIELMYPPEFAPDDVGRAREVFDDAVARARQLVTSWS